MWNTLVSIFPYAIAYTIPMLMTSLGACTVNEAVSPTLDWKA